VDESGILTAILGTRWTYWTVLDDYSRTERDPPLVASGGRRSASSGLDERCHAVTDADELTPNELTLLRRLAGV
jgi:hypothetical protein